MLSTLTILWHKTVLKIAKIHLIQAFVYHLIFSLVFQNELQLWQKLITLLFWIIAFNIYSLGPSW